MTRVQRVLLGGAAAVLAFDTVGSVAARTIGFDYTALSPGSYLIYGVTGFAAARASSFKIGVFAGALVALVEATIGWGISWIIGPGRVAEITGGALTMLVVIVWVTATGVVCGMVGAVLAYLLRTRDRAAA